jgi:hypothetical protein
MKIAIVKFYSGTNYGALLQAMCLREALRNRGHQTSVLNYLPSSAQRQRAFRALHDLFVRLLDSLIACCTELIRDNRWIVIVLNSLLTR